MEKTPSRWGKCHRPAVLLLDWIVVHSVFPESPCSTPNVLLARDGMVVIREGKAPCNFIKVYLCVLSKSPCRCRLPTDGAQWG